MNDITSIPEVSIIIIFKSFDEIEATIDSLYKCQKIDHCEVILIGDNADEQSRIYKKITKFKLKYLNTPGFRKLGKLRNIGISLAKSNYCYFIDSDCLLYEDTLAKLIEIKDISPVIRGHIEFSGVSFFSKIEAQIRTTRYSLKISNAYCPNLLVNNSVFEACGLFDESFYYGSDGEFSYRINDNLISVHLRGDVRVIHVVRASALQIVAKWFRYGQGRYSRNKKHNVPRSFRAYFPCLYDCNKGITYNVFVFFQNVIRFFGITQGYLAHKASLMRNFVSRIFQK